MKTVNTGSRFGMALLGISLLVGGVGCGAATTVSPRLSVIQEHATVQIDGQGKVDGGTIACGPTGGTCEGNFEDLWATQLVAQPAEGWKFVGWKRSAKQSLASGAGSEQTVAYTARFEREPNAPVAQSASRTTISE